MRWRLYDCFPTKLIKFIYKEFYTNNQTFISVGVLRIQ